MAENNKRDIWLKLVEFHVKHYVLMLVLIGLGTIFLLFRSKPMPESQVLKA